MDQIQAQNLLEDVRLAIGRLKQIEVQLEQVVVQQALETDERPFGQIEWIQEQMPGVSKNKIYDLANAGALPGLLRRPKGGKLIVRKAAFLAGMTTLTAVNGAAVNRDG